MTHANPLLAAADLCVKCGLCSPHCPTYRHTGNENESPRGRIALIQAWAGGQLDATPRLVEHIDNCLLCRSCERVCPAAVPYGRLIDDFRNLRSGGETSPALALITTIAHDPTVKRLSQRALSIYPQSRWRKIARMLGVLKLLRLQEIDRLLPDAAVPNLDINGYHPPQIEQRGVIGLFVGCMGTLLDQQTVQAAITVLTSVGFAVHVPAQQTCCGALALHNGDRQTAIRLATANEQAFRIASLDAIVTLASGCGSSLKEYQHSDLAEKIVDISAFLHVHADALAGRLKPLPAIACLHTPCSLKNVMRTEKSVEDLLKLIPQLHVDILPATGQCCGSAGSYMLDHAPMAQALLAELLDGALNKPRDYWLTSNIGCALHIAAGLRERQVATEVLHPVVLLARQLRPVDSRTAE